MTEQTAVRVVWKYVIGNPSGITWLRIPADAQFLSVQEQDGHFVMWFLVDPSEQPVDRSFHLEWTGRPVPNNAQYLGTVQLGELVWHLFELEFIDT